MIRFQQPPARFGGRQPLQLRADRACVRCGYGVAVDRASNRCPMCGGDVWRVLTPRRAA